MKFPSLDFWSRLIVKFGEYKSSLNDNILGSGLLVEITYHWGIYENQIVAFLEYRKQRFIAAIRTFCQIA